MFRINQLISIIKSFSPYKPQFEQSKIIRLLFISSCVSFSITALLLLIKLCMVSIFTPDIENTDKLDSITLLFATLCLISGHLGIITLLINELIKLKKWKKEEAENLIYEIDHDQEQAKKLINYEVEELDYLSYWLNKKSSRLGKRISSFFWEKTAIISMIGLIYTYIKETGGFEKLFGRVSTPHQHYNYLDDITIYTLAFLLGLSLGAIFLKKVIDHYTYLLEIVEIAVKFKTHKDGHIRKN